MKGSADSTPGTPQHTAWYTLQHHWQQHQTSLAATSNSNDSNIKHRSTDSSSIKRHWHKHQSQQHQTSVTVPSNIIHSNIKHEWHTHQTGSSRSVMISDKGQRGNTYWRSIAYPATAFKSTASTTWHLHQYETSFSTEIDPLPSTILCDTHPRQVPQCVAQNTL